VKYQAWERTDIDEDEDPIYEDEEDANEEEKVSETIPTPHPLQDTPHPCLEDTIHTPTCKIISSPKFINSDLNCCIVQF